MGGWGLENKKQCILRKNSSYFFHILIQSNVSQTSFLILFFKVFNAFWYAVSIWLRAEVKWVKVSNKRPTYVFIVGYPNKRYSLTSDRVTFFDWFLGRDFDRNVSRKLSMHKLPYFHSLWRLPVLRILIRLNCTSIWQSLA